MMRRRSEWGRMLRFMTGREDLKEVVVAGTYSNLP